jgi:hypothetical protein
MPGLGPHAGGPTGGLGFWAQQGFYGVPKIDYGPFILRGWLKSLPDQPPPPNAFQSWTWSYNLDLIGQDKLPAGSRIFDLAPAQRPYELTSQFTWQWSFNLSLMFQAPGQPLVGSVRYDLPSTYLVPYRIEQTWAASYNKNLIGQDRMLIGDQVTDRPQLPVPPAITWIATMPPSMATVVRPFAQYDWPLPLPQRPLDQSWYQNLDLLPKPPPPDTTHIIRPIWRSLPDQPAQPLLQQSPFPNLVISAVVVQAPFKQTDWPIPFAPQLATVSWTWSYNLKLIGQDKLPSGQQITELPPRDFARQFQTWINVTNLALTTAAPNLFAQARQQDWPVPRGPEPDWRRSWEWSYNLDLIGQDELPFRQSDWPLTPAAQRAVDLGTWIDRTKFLLAQLYKPFAQLDWPNPTPPARDPTLASLTASYNLNLIGQDRLPNRQSDWPLSNAHALNQIPLQAMVAGKGFWLVQFQPLPPGAIVTDRPQLRADVPADFYTIAERAQIVQPAPVVTPLVPNKPFLAGPAYLDVIPGEKPS